MFTKNYSKADTEPPLLILAPHRGTFRKGAPPPDRRERGKNGSEFVFREAAVMERIAGVTNRGAVRTDGLVIRLCVPHSMRGHPGMLNAPTAGTGDAQVLGTSWGK